MTNIFVAADWAEKTATAEGTVIRTWSSGSPRGYSTNYQTVRYRVDERVYEADFRTDSSRRKAGDQITVRYKPDNPSDASIDSWLPRWEWVFGLGVTGTLVVFIGSFMLWHRRVGRAPPTRSAA